MICETAQIACPKCRQASDACAWRERPIFGELPEDEYQCPVCCFAFKRERTGNTWKPINCVQIAPKL
jgi:hypothetical protein